MKIKISIIVGMLLVGVFAQQEKDQPAQTFTDGKSQPAVSYGLGSNGGYTLKNENNYKIPQIVPYLANSKTPYVDGPKPQEIVDEVPSVTNYYDGSNKLNTLKVQCRIYVNMNDCLHQAGCGWCGATASCVTGNQAGPMEPCSKSTYVFTSGAVHTAQERVVRENVGGIATTVISK